MNNEEIITSEKTLAVYHCAALHGVVVGSEGVLVRCRECKHWVSDLQTCTQIGTQVERSRTPATSIKLFAITKPDFFCAWGERE